MKRLQKLMMQDVGWKLLSLAIAITLWYMVINMEHPVTTRIYTQTIQLENIEALTDQGLTVLNQSQLEDIKVSAKIKAQRTSLDRLWQYRNNIKAVVDVSQLSKAKAGDTVSLDVDFVLPEAAGSDFEIVSQSPEKVDLAIEPLSSKKMKITVAMSGETSTGYTILQPQISPNVVQISGAASIVNRVAAVQVPIDLQQVSKDIVLTAEPIAYDENGKRVEGITMDVSQVRVSIGVQKKKIVAIQATTTGTPADGYEITNISWVPKSVAVSGGEEALANLEEITLPSIRVTGAGNTLTETFPLTAFLPNNVMLGNEEYQQVTVTVTIAEQERQQITVQSGEIVLHGTDDTIYDYTLAENTVSLQLSGSPSVLTGVTTGSIPLTADVTNLTIGEHTISLTAELPDGIRIIGAAPTVVVTIAEKQQPEQEEQPPEEILPPEEEPPTENED